jgi:spore coat-associated protein N
MTHGWEGIQMKRIKAAWDANPRKALLSLCALAVASAVIMASGANFTSTTANPGNVYTAGDLKHSNSKNGSAIFTADKMKPGESKSGTVDITNTGDIDGVFTLSKSNLTQTAGFASKLTLGVVDCKADGCGNANDSVVYPTGSLAGMGAQSLGTFAPGDVHRYQFTVTFPDGGSGGADNAYKAATASVQYDWESVNN